MAESENREKYPSNAYRNISPNAQNQDQKKKREAPSPVAKGKEKKKSIGERLTDSFLAANGEDIKERVIFDWVIPGIKNILEDIVHMLLFGDKPDSRITRSRGESRISQVRYDKYYDKRRERDEYIPQKKSRNPELIFGTRADAEDVLTRMFDLLSEYGRVTVKDLYSLADMPTDFAMSNWGWRDLTGSSVVEVRGGYLIKFPRSEELR